MPHPVWALDPEALLLNDRWIRSLARGLLANDSDVDDVLQETRLAALLRAPAQLDNPKSWLARVAWNFARKRRREETRRKRRERAISRPERLDGSPQEAIERVELRRQVLDAVLALREPYRSTVVLRFFEQMSLKEIADRHEVPLGTVKGRLSRSLGILRDRLTALYGTRGIWTALLVSLVYPSVTASAVAGAPGAAQAASGAASLKAGVLSMSMKTVSIAVCVSAMVVAGGLGILLRESKVPSRGAGASSDVRLPASPVKSAPERNEERPDGRIAVTRPLSDALREGEKSRDVASVESQAVGGGGAESRDASSADAPVAPGTASQEALATRRVFQELKARFGEGGSQGWKNVREMIARLQEQLFAPGDGFEEFLALLDQEADASFLEALMHHLPLAKTELRDKVLADSELHGEIWRRFEAAEEPERRLAMLRFFAFERKLSASRMGTFVELARSDGAPAVRQLCVDAVASNPDLIADTWAVLAHVLQHDDEAECRRTAVQGLAHAEAPEAAALVRAAFTSPDENLRAAVLSSVAGDRITDELSGGDATSYLVKELRSAQTRGYKKALVERLLVRSPEVLQEELQRALAGESDWGTKRDYREALEKIAASRAPRQEE